MKKKLECFLIQCKVITHEPRLKSIQNLFLLNAIMFIVLFSFNAKIPIFYSKNSINFFNQVFFPNWQSFLLSYLRNIAIKVVAWCSICLRTVFLCQKHVSIWFSWFQNSLMSWVGIPKMCSYRLICNFFHGIFNSFFISIKRFVGWTKRKKGWARHNFETFTKFRSHHIN